MQILSQQMHLDLAFWKYLPGVHFLNQVIVLNPTEATG